ncbi:MAG: SGNH/GDSL hydrolase family protein [Alphaproteobacteria bacterium]|nr:SGNH/GDSL hydrolase family protein [Alphaproteobacteria bacterium]
MANAGLALASLAFACLLGELVFRFAVPASDYPAMDYGGAVVRYAPGQSGVYRMRDEIAAPYRINAQGWNANRPRYVAGKPAGARRVAIVGDSYVEAFQVPVDASLAEQLEALPGASKLEVYRFGISGAPFSHYLWMAEREALRYRPDVLVFNLVHNDFDESLRPLPGRYSNAFATLAVENGRIAGDRPPGAAQPQWADALMRSAALRYLRFNRQVTLGAIYAALGIAPPRRVDDIAVPTPDPQVPGQAPGQEGAPGLPSVDANVEIARVLARPQLIEGAIDYLVGHAAAIGRSGNCRVLLLMDGARQAIYEGRDSRALQLNALVAAAARRHGVGFVDLHPLFAVAWQRDHQRFDFPHDGHWNMRGHALAARAIRDWIDR